MEKPIRRKKKEHAFAVTAFRVVQEATEQVEEAQDKVEADQQPQEGKNPHAVALGRLGGKKGGKTRAMRLTAAQRSEIARRAAEVRWRKMQ